ncbi:hypothetical protein AB0B18_28795 [Micromonospora chalcea]
MILMYVTDARPDYALNLLATTAYPRGFVNSYRYASKWVEPKLWSRWGSDGLVGETVLVCFLEGNKPGLLDAVAVPVRFGRVVGSETFGQFGVLEVALEAFAGARMIDELIEGRSERGIVAAGPPVGFFVSDVVMAAGVDQANDRAGWQGAVAMLSKMKTFAEASFLYVEGLSMGASGHDRYPTPRGYELASGRLYELSIHVIVPAGVDGHAVYRLHVDGDVVKLAEPPELRFGHRFSAHRIPIYIASAPLRHGGYIRIAPDPTVIGPEVKVPVHVRDGLLRRSAPIAAAATPAGLAATAGVLPDSAPIWLKIGMVVIGSTGLALATKRGTR